MIMRSRRLRNLFSAFVAVVLLLFLAGASALQAADLDGDGVDDTIDNCPELANFDQADNDGDEVGTVCDNCPSAANANQNDVDNDLFGDTCDNCPEVFNISQRDT